MFAEKILKYGSKHRCYSNSRIKLGHVIIGDSDRRSALLYIFLFDNLFRLGFHLVFFKIKYTILFRRCLILREQVRIAVLTGTTVDIWGRKFE